MQQAFDVPFAITPKRSCHTRSVFGTKQRANSRTAHLPVTAKVVVGIDLGTSNSAIAAIKDGHAHIIEGVDGPVTPSCVALLQVSQVL